MQTDEGNGGKNDLVIGDELKQKLNRGLILEDCAAEAVRHCEEEGCKLIDSGTGHCFGYKVIGNMTYWVEYKAAGQGVELLNAYCHRMKIETGAV